jgi:hypothetical protein
MWIHPINNESLGRNKLKTRNQIGIPWVSVNIGIGMRFGSRPECVLATIRRQPTLGFQCNSIPVAGRPANGIQTANALAK